MSTQDDSQNNNGLEDNTNQGHPAWQEILSVLPEEFHTLITPKLQEWDKGVQDKFQEIHTKYDPYKPLLDNDIPVDYINKALFLANTLEEDPKTVVQNAIEHFKLEDELKALLGISEPLDNTNEDEFDEDTPVNLDVLQKDPRFKEFFDKQKEIEQWYQSQQTEKEQKESASMLEDYLKGLHDQFDKQGGFDDIYVTALIANGIDGETAVKQFQQTVNQAAQALTGKTDNPVPPVVMGAGGTTGSGVPENNVSFGTMKNGEINDVVAELLKQAQSS